MVGHPQRTLMDIIWIRHVLFILAAAEYLRRGKSRMIWNDYHRLKDIHAFMDELEVDYPSICTGGIIGQSLECRPLKVSLFW